MEFRGQRFAVDFSDSDNDDNDHDDTPQHTHEAGVPSMLAAAAAAVPTLTSGFIGDIQEREVLAPAAPPKFKATSSGFPEHKKRTARMSAFKHQRAAATSAAAAKKKEEAPRSESGNAFGVPAGSGASAEASTSANTGAKAAQQGGEFSETERRRIDEENRKLLADMSAEEIEEERRELMASLDPSLVARLLKRADLDQGRGDTGIEIPGEAKEISAKDENGAEQQQALDEEDGASKDAEPAQAGVPAPRPSGKRFTASKSVNWEDEQEPSKPIDLQPASQPPLTSKSATTTTETTPLPPQQASVHFPSGPSAPDLDPSSPDFLTTLHEKYFPNLPADPSKLAWMAPLPTANSPADLDSPYYPSHPALAASALRFDFRGGILPPRIARAMPSTKGLHHHADAPEAAGYTIPELARLARSAFPAQRCIAFQTLGRVLYRLGRGEWGGEDDEMSKGLWRCVADGGVLRTLEEAAAVEGGHQGSKVYAVEAVWLWQKGGGKVWKAS